MCSTDIFLGLLAILFPPLPVWVKSGICSADSFINILLCMLGFLPGLFHAWYIIAKYPEPQYDYDAPYDAENGGGGRVYVFVHEGGAVGRQRQQQFRSQQPYKPGQPQPNMNYGTSNNQSHHSNQQQAGSSSASASRQPQQQPNNGGEGSSDAPPPSYAQVVAGDHKVQTQD